MLRKNRKIAKSDLPASLKIFEVDQKEVQELKKSRMPPEILAAGKATYVSVDFNTQTLTEQLRNVKKLLSISADKNSGGAAMELLKSTINMQPNLSLIQSKINQNNQTNNNQISTASIERDIKYLKINTD